MTEPEKPYEEPIDLGEAAWEPEPLFAIDAESGVDAPAAPAVEQVQAVADPGPTAVPAVDHLAVPVAGRGSPPRVVRPVVAGLTALLLLLTGFLAYRVTDSRGPAPVEQSRKDAVTAGRDAARLVFSYDYRRLDKDFQAGLATTTGPFRKDYENTTNKVVRPTAPRYKAVLVAEVSEAGVITASKDRVLLLVFLNVQSTSSLTTAPKITPRRLAMTMQRDGERWLVADIDAF
mgnify:CR=1 FL=1